MLAVIPTSISHPVSSKQRTIFSSFIPVPHKHTHLVRPKLKKIKFNYILTITLRCKNLQQKVCFFSFFVCASFILPFRLVTLQSRTVREHGTINQMSKRRTWWCHDINFWIKSKSKGTIVTFSGLPSRCKRPWTWLSRSPKWSKIPDATKKERQMACFVKSQCQKRRGTLPHLPHIIQISKNYQNKEIPSKNKRVPTFSLVSHEVDGKMATEKNPIKIAIIITQGNGSLINF